MFANTPAHSKARLALCAIAVIALALSGLAGCSSSPSKSEYVGVWACYTQKTDKAEYNPSSIDEVVSFMRLMPNGDGELIARVNGGAPYVLDCYWLTTRRNKDAGTDTGIVLIGKDESFENPYRYFEDSETHLASESLIDGKLAIDFGYRREYYEKISDDADYQPWLEGGSDSSVDTPSGGAQSAQDASSLSVPAGAISWEEASSHIGERVSVYGEVKAWDYRSESNGRPTYIDIGAAYPDKSRVTVVVWEEDRDAFPGIADNTGYVGQIICVTGEIYEYNGVCNIKAESPSQIEVLG